MRKKSAKAGEKRRESLTFSPQSPSFFPFLPIPYPFRRLSSLRRHDKTLQETITFTDKTKIAYNYSDPGGTLEKIKQP